MKYLLPVVTALFVAPSFAQDPAAPPAAEQEGPKCKEHEVLRELVGNWEFVMKMEAMPGVPGMETPTESKGTEHVELICNGLWMKSEINATYRGAPFQGIWLAGYDPAEKRYTSIWVSSDEQECGVATMDGTYDAATRTFTWSGETPQGAMRSIYKLEGNDRVVETCYMTPPGGKETRCMEIVRERTKKPIALDATGAAAKKPTKEIERLLADVGEWTATVTTLESPDAKPVVDKGNERVAAVCNGRWLWSDFRGQFQGQPFEGHSLFGYDPVKKQYVSIWIDTCSPHASTTTGSFDEATNAYTLTGTCPGMDGKPMQVKQVMSRKNGARTMRMECTCEQGTMRMDVDYQRKS